jgi:hypothetical protein
MEHLRSGISMHAGWTVGLKGVDKDQQPRSNSADARNWQEIGKVAVHADLAASWHSVND